jgi:hypothetical protein
MPKHKAATEVSISSYEEPSLLQVWVARYWKMAAGVAVVISAVILFKNYQSSQRAAVLAARWDALSAGMDIDPFSGRIYAQEDKMIDAVKVVEGTAAEPWALLGLAQAAIAEGNYPTAKDAVAKAKALGVRELSQDRFVLGPGSESTTLLDWLEDKIERQEIWDEAHPGLLKNPMPPADCPKVRLVTGAGEILLGLYEKEAPEHVANFLKLCREGFYNGTKFHRVMAGFMIQGGDPNSKEMDFSTWGQGGPGYKAL